MIDAQHLTERYGAKTAVDDLTLTVRPGIVTALIDDGLPNERMPSYPGR